MTVDNLELSPVDPVAPLRVRIRHGGEMHLCQLSTASNELLPLDRAAAQQCIQVETQTPMWAPAAGQLAVFYQGSCVVGHGEIATDPGAR